MKGSLAVGAAVAWWASQDALGLKELPPIHRVSADLVRHHQNQCRERGFPRTVVLSLIPPAAAGIWAQDPVIGLASVPVFQSERGQVVGDRRAVPSK